jgi:N-methylhydantoinase A/oxoprolinase/acetone carboxylase beta subunit
MTRDTACRLGVDVGGTFTDLVLVTQDGHVVTRKVLSTSGNYAEAIFAGVHDVLEKAGISGDRVRELIHGTTVATNAIIERCGARAGLVTTEGFGDLLEIGRLRLMRLYDMDQDRPAPLVRRRWRWRFEVLERLDHRGAVIRPLDPNTLEQAVAGIAAEKIESVAVCLIHAYANRAHERAFAAAIRVPAALTFAWKFLPLARARARGTETSVIPSDDAHYHPLTSAGYSPVVPDNDLAGRHQQTGCARMFLSLNHFRNPYKNIKAGKIIVVQSQETFSAMDFTELVPSAICLRYPA